MNTSFPAYVVRQDEQGRVHAAIEQLRKEDLPNGDVSVHVQYSSVNYKDGLAAAEKGGVVRHYPMVPGIDIAGSSKNRSAAGLLPETGSLVRGMNQGFPISGDSADMRV